MVQTFKLTNILFVSFLNIAAQTMLIFIALRVSVYVGCEQLLSKLRG